MDEEIKTQGKQWQRPELTVLVRSKPEEAVLATCKNTGTGGTGPGAANVYCQTTTRACGTCNAYNAS